jgi:hypothetical protein
MTVTVELGAFNGFTLDSQTLGRLDVNILDGGVDFQDVTDALVGVSVGRGRARDLERTSAGQVSASFRNDDRRFDPLNSGSDLRLYTTPRKPVRVSADGTAVFTGLIDDWNFSYEIEGNSIASITGSDALSLFAREENQGGAVAEELSGARIENVLDQVKIVWPSLERDIDTGAATLASGVLEGNVLQYLQSVETSESGLVFMTKDGKVAFRQRAVPSVSDPVTFSDTGAGIAYQAIEIDYGSELLVNDVTVTSAEGTVTAQDVGSQTLYGVTAKSFDTLLASSSLQPLADYIVGRYKDPEYRIGAVTVRLDVLSEADRLAVLGLELGDQADVLFTPNGVGQQIALRNRVIGVSHQVGFVEHLVTFRFEELPYEFFVLDDDPFGRLDADGVLGF